MALRALIILLCLGISHATVLNLSCKQIKKLVDSHNLRRLLVAQGKVDGHPAASKMHSLIWDEELAEKAAEWAGNNKFQHNPDRTIPSRKFDTGENIYIYMTTDSDYKFDIETAVKSWFDEYKDWSYSPLSSDDFNAPKDIGHYTQMVWSKSVYVGCGVSQWKEDNWHKTFVVCNYGPAGNYMGETPYPAGEPSNRLECGAKSCRRPYGSRCNA